MEIPLVLRLQQRGIQIASYLAPSWAGHWAARRFTTPQRYPRPDWEKKILDQGNKIELSGGLAAWSWGSGPGVLLVHGWDGRGSQLGAFVGPIVAAGFQVFTWDNPAHGDSPGERTNLSECVKCIMEIQQKFGAIEAIIGHSLGVVATVLAASRGVEANHLVLISGPCLGQDIFNYFIDAIKLSPQAAKIFQETVEKEAGIKASDIQVHLMGPKIKAKTLLIHDTLDKEVPFSQAQKIAASWTSARLLVTDGLGHRRILQSQDVINQVVSFIGAGS